jgi:hypothetical protein
LQDPQKFTPIAIFGLKMYHLATLVSARLDSADRHQSSFDAFTNSPEKKREDEIRAARRYFFKPNIQIWENFGVS